MSRNNACRCMLGRTNRGVGTANTGTDTSSVTSTMNGLVCISRSNCVGVNSCGASFGCGTAVPSVVCGRGSRAVGMAVSNERCALLVRNSTFGNLRAVICEGRTASSVGSVICTCLLGCGSGSNGESGSILFTSIPTGTRFGMCPRAFSLSSTRFCFSSACGAETTIPTLDCIRGSTSLRGNVLDISVHPRGVMSNAGCGASLSIGVCGRCISTSSCFGMRITGMCDRSVRTCHVFPKRRVSPHRVASAMGATGA